MNFITNFRFGFAKLFLLASVLSLSCNLYDNPIAPNQSPSSVIMPLKVGNKWIYEGKQFNTDGTVINNFNHTIEVNGEKTIDGKLWYIVNEVYLARNSPEGLWSAEYMFDEIYGLSLISKYPGLCGDSWDNNNFSIVSADTLIKVQSGEFHCLKYKIDSQVYETPFFSYESPNVGIIRTEHYMKDKNGNTFLCEVSELKTSILK